MNGIPSQEQTQPSTASILLRFAIEVGPAGGHLLLPQTLHCEVWAEPKIARLPGTLPFLRGLINLRGQLAPVYELAGAMAALSPAPAVARLVVLGSGESRVGLIVQGDPRPIRVQAAAAAGRARPSTAFAGAAHLGEDGHYYWDFDLESFLTFVRRDAASVGAPLLTEDVQ